MAREPILPTHGYGQIVRISSYSENLMWDVLWYLLLTFSINLFYINYLTIDIGGEGGIRTHGTGKPHT